MFVVTDNGKLKKAQERAAESRPAVRIVTHGDYRVEGSAGNFYAVKIGAAGFRTFADCGCMAGLYGNE